MSTKRSKLFKLQSKTLARYKHTPWKRFKPARHQANRTWLVHVQPEVDGLVHFLLCAKTIDEAWKQAMEIPRTNGTAPRLGGIVDAGHWPSFMAVKLQLYCNQCSRRSVLLTPREEQQWEEMALAYEAGWKEVIE